MDKSCQGEAFSKLPTRRTRNGEGTGDGQARVRLLSQYRIQRMLWILERIKLETILLRGDGADAVMKKNSKGGRNVEQ